jgi:hypothetical protein
MGKSTFSFKIVMFEKNPISLSKINCQELFLSQLEINHVIHEPTAKN